MFDALKEPQLTSVEGFYDFVALPENTDKRFELIDGHIIEMAPPPPLNAFLAARLVRLLGNFVEEHGLGYVFGPDGGYTLSPTHVRIPDVSFVEKSRLVAFGKTMDFAPDLAVEVISQRESALAVRQKITLYLDSGVRLIWIVYPEARVVDVYQPSAEGTQVQSLDVTGILSGGAVLPNFQLPLIELFKNLPP